MARDHTRINVDIWGDDEWLDVSPEAQHLYFVLYTWPPSFCGAGDWLPRKVATRSRGWTVPRVLDAAEELVAGEFLLIDIDTEEYLLRSWIKHDGLFRQPNMAVSVANARVELASRTLKAVVVHEVRKLRSSEPDLVSWTKPAVARMLEQNAIDPVAVDWSSPWDSTSVSTWASSRDSTSVSTKPSTSVQPCPTPAPAPAPAPSSSSKESGARGSRLDPDWTPKPEVVAQMRSEQPTIDLKAEHAKFVDYWLSKPGKDGRKVDWNATWRNWIRNARPSANGHTGSTADKRVAQAQALKDKPPTRLELT